MNFLYQLSQQDTRTNKALPKLDLNVLPLYRLGVNGRGVRIAVLDDGLEYSHDDLRNNYVRNMYLELLFRPIDDETCYSESHFKSETIILFLYLNYICIKLFY